MLLGILHFEEQLKYEDGDGPFSVAAGNWTRRNGFKLKQGKFRLDI